MKAWKIMAPKVMKRPAAAAAAAAAAEQPEQKQAKSVQPEAERKQRSAMLTFLNKGSQSANAEHSQRCSNALTAYQSMDPESKRACIKDFFESGGARGKGLERLLAVTSTQEESSTGQSRDVWLTPRLLAEQEGVSIQEDFRDLQHFKDWCYKEAEKAADAHGWTEFARVDEESWFLSKFRVMKDLGTLHEASSRSSTVMDKKTSDIRGLLDEPVQPTVKVNKVLASYKKLVKAAGKALTNLHRSLWGSGWM